MTGTGRVRREVGAVLPDQHQRVLALTRRFGYCSCSLENV
jgi:hypothetical protein